MIHTKHHTNEYRFDEWRGGGGMGFITEKIKNRWGRTDDNMKSWKKKEEANEKRITRFLNDFVL